jgi:hypothetical protein
MHDFVNIVNYHYPGKCMLFDIRSGSYLFFTSVTNLLASFIRRYVYRAGFNYCIIILCSIMWQSLSLLL